MLFETIIPMIGGLVFFMFGMNVMSNNLERMAGGKLERLLKLMTSNPIISIALGAAITIALQSSSAITVMMVGLVNSGLMTMSQTLFAIYGANIGTTITSWILSLAGIESDNPFMLMLKPENFSPIIALIGIGMVMLSKNDKKKSVGTVFVGFAVLIYGMELMSGAVKPLADEPWFGEMLTKFNNPLLGMLIGTVLTAIIQSSAATIGMVQAISLAEGSMMTNAMAIPIVMGANIGTCATSLISCIGTNRRAKQVAVIHLMINVVGTVLWLTLFSVVNALFEVPFFDSIASPVTVAIAHSVFNIATVIVLMPLTKWLEKLVCKLVPEEKGGINDKRLFLDERLLQSPSVAVTECNNATGKMAHLAWKNLLLSMELLEHFDRKKYDLIVENEDLLDDDEDKLGSYLVKLSSQALSHKDSQIVSKMLHVIGDFERLGDHALNLAKTAEEIYEKKLEFTPAAQKELGVLSAAIKEIMDLTGRAYVGGDLALAAQVEPLEQVIDGIIAKIRSNHINRLQGHECTIEMGFVLHDLLNNYERISDHCSNVAVVIIEVDHDSFDTHKYLNAVKYGNEEFDECYQDYAKKFALV